jgi:hypothetical protein
MANENRVHKKDKKNFSHATSLVKFMAAALKMASLPVGELIPCRIWPLFVGLELIPHDLFGVQDRSEVSELSLVQFFTQFPPLFSRLLLVPIILAELFSKTHKHQLLRETKPLVIFPQCFQSRVFCFHRREGALHDG